MVKFYRDHLRDVVTTKEPAEVRQFVFNFVMNNEWRDYWNNKYENMKDNWQY